MEETSNSSNKKQKTVADAMASLEAILNERAKAIEERERTLDHRETLLKAINPAMGGPEDIVPINVGGTTKIGVLRRVLTFYEDSMLASRFSGRWDDSLEKDKDGNFFVDQDPELFLKLIAFLRLQYNATTEEEKAAVVPPSPTCRLSAMLNYYGLMQHVYPIRVDVVRQASSARPVTTTYNCNSTEITITCQGHCIVMISCHRPISGFVLESDTIPSGLQVGWTLVPSASVGKIVVVSES